jgi:hypothetical protein
METQTQHAPVNWDYPLFRKSDGAVVVRIDPVPPDELRKNVWFEGEETCWRYYNDGRCCGIPARDLTNFPPDVPEVDGPGSMTVTFVPAGRFEYAQDPERVTQPTRGDYQPEDDLEFLSIDWLIDLHETTCNAAQHTMLRKNHDYTAGSDNVFANFEGSSSFGIHPIMGIILRLTDKLKRIETFVTKGTLKVKGEGVDDAIEDAINYLILIKGLVRKEQANQ